LEKNEVNRRLLKLESALSGIGSTISNKEIFFNSTDWKIDTVSNLYKITITHGLNTKLIVPVIYNDKNAFMSCGGDLIDNNSLELINDIGFDGKIVLNYASTVISGGGIDLSKYTTDNLAEGSTRKYMTLTDKTLLYSRLGKNNIKAGDNITVDVNGNDVIINSIGGGTGLTPEQVALLDLIPTKQDINDVTLTTPTQTIPSAINYIYSEVEDVKNKVEPHVANLNNPHQTSITNLKGINIAMPQDMDSIVYDISQSKFVNKKLYTLATTLDIDGLFI
jgi:hypothetical protein